MRARSEQLKIDYPRLTVVSSVQESFVNLWSAAIRPCARVCVALECELGSSATDCVKNCIRHTYLRKCVGNLSRSDACYLQDSDPNISNHVLVFFLCSKNKNVPQLCACEEGVYIPWPQLRFPSMVPRICSVLTVLKVNKNHLLPLYRYLEVLNKAKCASVGRSNCIKRVNGTGSFISTLPMHSGSEKVSMSRHVGLIWQLRVAVCPIRCSFVVVSRSSAQRVKQHPRGHHKWPKSDFFFFPL